MQFNFPFIVFISVIWVCGRAEFPFLGSRLAFKAMQLERTFANNIGFIILFIYFILREDFRHSEAMEVL